VLEFFVVVIIRLVEEDSFDHDCVRTRLVEKDSFDHDCVWFTKTHTKEHR
jgi:hypothetical protein